MLGTPKATCLRLFFKKDKLNELQIQKIFSKDKKVHASMKNTLKGFAALDSRPGTTQMSVSTVVEGPKVKSELWG